MEAIFVLRRSKIVSVFLSLILLSLALTLASAPARAAGSTSIAISQVYGGAGCSTANCSTYKNDFIELFNLSGSAQSINGWSVQYASAGGSSWQVTTLPNVTISPGHYFLVAESYGANGINTLPTPDTTGTIMMSATSAKVALVKNTTALSCGSTNNCLPNDNIVDFVGYGTSASSWEGTGRAPAPSTTTADLRKDGGATDTDDNSQDFAAGTPTPRNSGLSTSGAANPSALLPGTTTLLTVAVAPATNPPSTGITVSCDLSSIGGSALQTFYDDGSHGDATAGDNIFSLSYAVPADTAIATKHLSCASSDEQARTGSTEITLYVLAVTPIGTVNGPVSDTDNGATHTAAQNGQVVAVQGVIYEKTLQAKSGGGVYYGFFIQNTAATADGNPNTSDGLYVFMNTTSTMSGWDGSEYYLSVGEEVILSGYVSEYYNMTELTSPTLLAPVLRSGVDLYSEITPFIADPPDNIADANRYWERRQGMRAQVPQNSIALNGRNVFNPPDGEVWLARPDSTIATRISPYERRAFRDAHPLDDNYDANNWDGNGYRILMGSWGIKFALSDGQALITPARTFSTLTSALVGGVNYSFSKYRIEVTTQPTFSEGVDPAANNPPQTFDRTHNYSIVDYNLENLYDFRDNPFSGCDFATDSQCVKVDPFLAAVTSPFDYVPASDAAYQARLTDIAHQIIDDLHSPDILMLQEVENQDICTVSLGVFSCGETDNADGKPDVLQDLALKIASLGGPAYDAAFDRDSSDLRGILPAFMYRTDRVQLAPTAGDPLLGATPAIDYAGAGVAANADETNPKTLNAVLPGGIAQCETKWVFPRAPDIGLFRIYRTTVGVGGYREVYVINNHFKSGPDTCTGHRTEQAKYNAAIVKFLQAAKPNARIVVGGDLNVYPRPDDPFAPIGQPSSSDQLGALYNPDLELKNLWEVLRDQAPAAAYSYVYLGMAQTLDQVFVNQAMLTDLHEYRIAHINSDFAADYTGDSARGTSDHDPQVVMFTLNVNDPPTAHANGPYFVNEGGNVQLNGTGTDPENGTLTYAWDLDNNGTFEYSGANPTVSAIDIPGPAMRTVTLQVMDDGGLTATDSATINIVNLAPSITSVTNNGPIVAGGSATVSVSASDPGGAGDTLQYSFDCDNDGAYEVNWQNGNSASCSFASVGTFTVNVRVKDSAPSSATGSTSVVVNNPAPTLTSISPTSAQAGGPAFTLTVTGTNFINGSVVRWNGADLATSFVSSTRMTATVPASNLSSVGSASVTAFNPAPGGGTSSPQTFAIGLTSTGLQLTASSSSIRVGQPVTLTATLTQVYSAQSRARGPRDVTPSGTITFTLDSTTNITRPVGANGVTSYMTNTLTVGTHTATAKYSGDANLVSATSAPVSILVNSIKTFFPFIWRGSVSPQSSP